MNEDDKSRALLQELLWWWDSDQYHMSEYHGNELMRRIEEHLGIPQRPEIP